MADAGSGSKAGRRTPQQETERQNRLKRARESVEAPTPAAQAPAPAARLPERPVGEFRELFLKFLPNDVTEEEIAGIFSAVGPLDGVPVLQRDFASGKPRGSEDRHWH